MPKPSDMMSVIERFPHARVMVVGDMMLDVYIYGTASRLSPEAPVPVLHVTREQAMPGGAGNVLINLRTLGVDVRAVGVVGTDQPADIFLKYCRDMGVKTQGVVADPSRPTIQKIRHMAGQHQLLRSDIEDRTPLSERIEDSIKAEITRAMDDRQIVIVSDYAKGVLSPRILAHVMTEAKARSIPVLVDPKGKDFTRYRGAHVVTPNRAELALAAEAETLSSDQDIEIAAQKILNQCGIDHILVTRSEDGMTLIQGSADKPIHFRAKAREVYDVSGAGDTVMSVLAASLAVGASLVQASDLANLAGGIAVGKIGTAPVRPDELIQVLSGDSSSAHMAPVMSVGEMKACVQSWQSAGLKVGFTNGCFDILHYGHVTYLAQARARCDKLIVGLNHDISVRLLKGATRPVNDEQARARVISALASVDGVVLFGATMTGADNTPCALIDSLRPDLFFKGGDYTPDQLPEAKIVSQYGGQVCIMKMYEGYSTTATLQKINNPQAA